MTSRTTKQFRAHLDRLPKPIRRQAFEAYKQFCVNPQHPSLRFKQLRTTAQVYSVRVSTDYRAVGVRDRDEIIWFWIGSHADYDQLLKTL